MPPPANEEEESASPGNGLAVLHPVLCAELADESAYVKLAAIAETRGTAILPLLDAPVDTAVHVLEITTQGQSKPLVVFAEPLGPPGEHGFPLRLHPYDGPAPEGRRVPRPLPADTPHFGAARPKRTTLTDRHSRDLSGEHAREDLDTPARAEMLVGRDIANGKLVIEALVGIGGMGVVYRARHRQLGMDIAVKILHERYRADVAFSARFHAEALAVSQLDHPNVVRIVDYGQEPDGLLYLAMDFLRGEELETILQREGALALPRVIDIGMQVAAGLGHAHARGIVHRDVKPSNLVLVAGEDDEGNPIAIVKICDFGIAIHEGSGDHLGTPAYMSPEQCTHERVDARSDVYSLGVILYELATGQLPFSGSAEEILRRHVTEAPAPPSSIAPVDPRLERTILDMMSKSPESRPQTMRAVRHALRAVARPVESAELSLHGVGASRATREREREVEPPSGNRPAPHTSVDGMPAPVDPHALARALAVEPVSTVREKLVSLEALVAAARPLALALRVVLEEGELAAFTEATLVLRRVIADHAADPRAELAARILRSLHDPSLFARAAERALVSDDEIASAALATVGVAGAHALYAARLRVQPTPAVRGRFVATLRAMGPSSAPLLEAALDRNAPGDSQEHDQRLAEDLLRALTPVPSDALGVTLARHLRWGAASVRRASVPALVAAWGERARAMLLGLLSKDPDEPTRVVAVKGLRELGTIDEHIVRRAREALAGVGCGPSLEGAITEMLLEATPDARPFAAEVLKGVLTPKGGIPALVRAKGAAAVGLVLTAARGYLELAPREGVPFVEELARSCEEPLRTQLHGLLGRVSDAAPSSRAPR